MIVYDLNKKLGTKREQQCWCMHCVFFEASPKQKKIPKYTMGHSLWHGLCRQGACYPYYLLHVIRYMVPFWICLFMRSVFISVLRFVCHLPKFAVQWKSWNQSNADRVPLVYNKKGALWWQGIMRTKQQAAEETEHDSKVIWTISSIPMQLHGQIL